MTEVLRAGGFQPPVGGGGKPLRKPGQKNTGRAHETEATMSKPERAAAKNLRKELAKGKGKEVLPSVETDVAMKDEDDSDFEITGVNVQ